MTPDLASLAAWSAGLKLMWAVVAFAVFFGLLRVRDKLLDLDWRNEVWKHIVDEGSVGLYCGLWAVAVAIIVGFVTSFA